MAAKPGAAEGPAEPAVREGFLELPPPFVIGSGTAAYQVEGGAFQGGRWSSIWDEFCREPSRVFEGHTGDVACDHYHRFKDDVALMAHLGLHAYRFSISWSRLIPEGVGDVNEEGARFYSDLIDALLEKGITPWVTLYHWDLPSSLEYDFGGWHGPKERMVAAFGAFARTCFQRFGNRVKHWLTLNEPWCVAVMGHLLGTHPPRLLEAKTTQPYEVAHNLLLSHAEAVRIYRAEFAEQGGQIGMALCLHWFQPLDPSSEEDVRSAQRARDFALGWFADPVYFGDYPASMRETCGSRLPSFTEAEKALLQGSTDFFGINCYSTYFARAGNPFPEMPEGWFYDMNVLVPLLKDPAWESTGNSWPIVPWGLREMLLYIQDRYKPAGGIVVTENGCAHEPDASFELDKEPDALIPKEHNPETCPPEDLEDETFEDPHRVRFLRAHLAAVHAARERGADVRGYFAWSTFDNFEWFDGYKQRFGIVRVDFRTQRRVIKASGRWLGDVARRGGLEAPPKAEQYPGHCF